MLEGCYIYQCEKCHKTHGLVSRLSHPDDYLEQTICPACNSAARIIGEGSISYEIKEDKQEQSKDQEVLDAKGIMHTLKVSQGKAYEIMNLKDFPLIRIGRSKRVFKKDLMEWLKNKK